MTPLPVFPDGPHGSKFTPERREAFIRAIEQGRTLGVACARAGITRRSFDRWAQRAEEQTVEDWREYARFIELVVHELLTYQDTAEGVVARAVIAGDVKTALKVLEKIDEQTWGPKRASTVAIEAQAGSSVNVVVTPIGREVDPADVFRRRKG